MPVLLPDIQAAYPHATAQRRTTSDGDRTIQLGVSPVARHVESYIDSDNLNKSSASLTNGRAYGRLPTRNLIVGCHVGGLAQVALALGLSFHIQVGSICLAHLPP